MKFPEVDGVGRGEGGSQQGGGWCALSAEDLELDIKTPRDLGWKFRLTQKQINDGQ